MRQDFWVEMIKIIAVGSIGVLIILFAEFLGVTENAAVFLGMVIALGVGVLLEGRRRDSQRRKKSD